MSDVVEEMYSPNKKVKAIITKRSEQVLSIQLFLFNEGVIKGYGFVHEPVWERVASTLFADSLDRAQFNVIPIYRSCQRRR